MQWAIRLLSLQHNEHKKKKRGELWLSDLHSRGLESFCAVKLLDRVCCFLNLRRHCHGWTTTWMFCKLHNSKRYCFGGLKTVSRIQWIQIPAEVWQRTESVPGMPALMAEGQTLISDARHVSPPISIKPRLWLAHTMHNSRFSKAYAASSAIRLSLKSGRKVWLGFFFLSSFVWWRNKNKRKGK